MFNIKQENLPITNLDMFVGMVDTILLLKPVLITDL